MMKIFINGKQENINDDLSVEQLLEQLGLTKKRVALEINQEIIPRSMHAGHRLYDGDQVEIIHAIGGG